MLFLDNLKCNNSLLLHVYGTCRVTNRAYGKNNGDGLLCSILWYSYNFENNWITKICNSKIVQKYWHTNLIQKYSFSVNSTLDNSQFIQKQNCSISNCLLQLVAG
jgi:hypothetical protein